MLACFKCNAHVSDATHVLLSRDIEVPLILFLEESIYCREEENPLGRLEQRQTNRKICNDHTEVDVGRFLSSFVLELSAGNLFYLYCAESNETPRGDHHHTRIQV